MSGKSWQSAVGSGQGRKRGLRAEGREEGVGGDEGGDGFLTSYRDDLGDSGFIDLTEDFVEGEGCGEFLFVCGGIVEGYNGFAAYTYGRIFLFG